MRTVQGQVEEALSRVFGKPVVTNGAGRTDAGVHALGQVMNTSDAPDSADVTKVRDALNAMCGPWIAVHACTAAHDDFHARFSARSRAYVYAILEGDVHDPFLSETTLHHASPLDVDAMNEAAGHLLGERDFTSFGRVEPGAAATRTLYELRCARAGRIVRVWARANGFLQQMVRSLVGTLVYVGEGRRSPDDVAGMLAARDRAAAGPVAAPHGLCLVSVEYPGGFSGPPAA